MTIEEIRKNAPSGASHYGNHEEYDHMVNYFIVKDGEFFHWCGFD